MVLKVNFKLKESEKRKRTKNIDRILREIHNASVNFTEATDNNPESWVVDFGRTIGTMKFYSVFELEAFERGLHVAKRIEGG